MHPLRFVDPYLQFPMDEHLTMANSWSSLAVCATDCTFQPCRRQSSHTVPDVLHMKLRDALFLLEKNGLKVTVEGNIHGVVSSQSRAIAHQITILLK